METSKPVPTDQATMANPANKEVTTRPQTEAEKFNEELLVLLNKYPTIRLTVNHQISINDIGTKPEGVQVTD